MATIQNIAANASGEYRSVSIDISNANEQVIFDVRDWSSFSIQAIQDGAVTVGSLVQKVQVSQDAANPVDFPSGGVTLSAAGISAILNVISYGYVHCIITTAGTSGSFRLFARASKVASV